MATKNTSVTNLAITMFCNLQNASFMHISSPINATEDVYVTLGHFVKDGIQDGRFKVHYGNVDLSKFALFFAFLMAQTFVCQENGLYKYKFITV